MSDSGAGNDGVRMCRDCGAVKPLTDLHVSPERSGGRGSYCKPRFNERSKRSYAKRAQERYGRQVRERLTIPDGHRHCPDCAEIKPVEAFPKSRAGRGGFGSYCKPCHNARGKAGVAKRGCPVSTTCARATASARRTSTRCSPGKGASAPSVAPPTPNTSITITAPAGFAGYCASTATAAWGSSGTTRCSSPKLLRI